MSAGLELPRCVFGHGWVNWQGQRMSKSLGTSVDPLEAADRFGPDPLRLYLVKEIAYGQDGDFTWERFEERYNVDLANNLGNLVNRVTAMVHKYREGRVSPVTGAPSELAVKAAGFVERYRTALDDYELHTGVAAAFELVDATNEFIARSEPWSMAKDPDGRHDLDQALFDMVEAVRVAALLLWPVMPSSAAEIWRRMGTTTSITDARLDTAVRWQTAERQIMTGPPLWPRIEDRAVAVSETGVKADARQTGLKGGTTVMKEETETAAVQEPVTPARVPSTDAATPAPPPKEPRVSFDEFMKVQLRVAKVLAARAVPKSKKLLEVTVDDGRGERTLVAGIARAYAPDTLVGRTVVIVANLEKARLMGIESNGMILAATDPDGQPVLLGVDDPVAAPPGSRVR